MVHLFFYNYVQDSGNKLTASPCHALNTVNGIRLPLSFSLVPRWREVGSISEGLGVDPLFPHFFPKNILFKITISMIHYIYNVVNHFLQHILES